MCNKYEREKPLVKSLNLDFIKQDLWDIQDVCEEIHWYTDSDDGEDSLINALDGDEDEAYEFKMAFADLCGECEQMLLDLDAEWVPDCFDILFIAAGAASTANDFLIFDEMEQDYYGIDCRDALYLEDNAKNKIRAMKKEDIIVAVRQCFKVYAAYVGLKNRYDNLKAAIDVLRDKNTGILQVVKEIDKLYEAASAKQGIFAPYSPEWKSFERYTDALPPEAWIA